MFFFIVLGPGERRYGQKPDDDRGDRGPRTLACHDQFKSKLPPTSKSGPGGTGQRQDRQLLTNTKLCSQSGGQFHEERDKVKKKYGFFHCKLIALTQTVLHVLGKNVFSKILQF